MSSQKTTGRSTGFQLPGRSSDGKQPGDAGQDEYRLLTVRQLMWRKFARNRMAVISGIALIVLYLVTVFAGFFGPYGIQDGEASLSFAPPMRVRFYDPENQTFSLRPFIFPLEGGRDPETFQLEYEEDRSRKAYLYFFVRGEPYKILAFFESDLRLFGLDTDETRVYIMGADQRGRDLYSRILVGGQVSLSVGIIGVGLMVVLGSVIGTLSGYFGGTFDNITQRLIETLQTFPQLPLWMALSAAIPPTWPPERVYAGIVIVLAFVNWTGLSREVRGLVFSLKERDFVASARPPAVRQRVSCANI